MSPTPIPRSSLSAEQRQQRLLIRRKEVGLLIDRVTDVVSTDFPGHYPGEDNAWDLERFKKQFHVQIHEYEDDHMVFDLVGIDAAIANAIRRILIAETPAMAIEYAYISQNTSVVQDEVLAQRLGLVPICAPIEMFEYPVREVDGTIREMHDRCILSFKLHVKCERNPRAAPDETDPKKLYINSDVTSGMLEFEPKGGQADFLPEGSVEVANKDILLAKLRPGQEIICDCIAILGVGKDHAKFSPVAPATYRLMPTVTITQPITGDDAHRFSKCFSKGVIKVRTSTGKPAEDASKSRGGIGSNEVPTEAGVPYASVRNPRGDSVSREALRHPEFSDKVRLGRRRDHFIFDIEGTGVRAVDNLVVNAIDLLMDKCVQMKQEIERQRGEMDYEEAPAPEGVTEGADTTDKVEE
ncbi:DNA-directed RNA polymerase core subunit rpc40 [Savitreella phatthalungensis]